MTAAKPWGESLTWREALEGPRRLGLSAGPSERADIARQFDLEALESLVAEVSLRPWLDGVEIEGRVRGVAIRQCGLSLESFEEIVDEPIRLRVAPTGSPNLVQADEREILVDLDAEDPPEEAGAAIDLAGYVTEVFGLGLAPFPRKPGAVFAPPTPSPADSPFAALARIATPRQDD